MTESKTESSQLVDCDHIPIIDLSALDSRNFDERRKLAQSIYDACTQAGFFYIKNHGISEEKINGIHSSAKRFFDLPDSQKMKFYIGNSSKFRGYSPLGSEKSTGTEDDPIAEEDAVGALSEAFDIGYETAMDPQKPKDDPLPRDPYGLYGDNQLPGPDILPGFTETYIEYCAMMLGLCRKLMRIFALALDLPEEHFDSMTQNPGVTSRMMHYPPQPVEEEVREGLGAHTDFECFTILSQGSVPGLQVLSHSGEWILAPPLPGTLVVNIADCLKSTENRINTFPQYTTEIEGLTIHFVGLFSERKDAVPLLLLHGWPGSFLEFLPMLQKFREEYTPETLPYHLIVPSLPGFTFSSGPPLDRDFEIGDVARVMDQLMKGLGFGSGYVAQGGDIGSRMARHLGVEYESCKVNVVFMRKPDGMSDDHLNASERQGIQRMTNFVTTGAGYAMEQGTRPSTIGHVLASSPIALLAWIGEKFLEWVDDPLAPDDILESVTLYWLTETFPRAIYTYRANYPAPPLPSSNDPRWYIHKPFGFSSFPMELAPLPRSWIETTGDLVFWEQHPKGGHFAALEQPDELKADLVKFVDQVWPGIIGAD
ncbi:Isopenicillin N synthase [Penicillium robsamsonii]|uniref:Isopenicillin N synthase n=1 Tax=Penicillium robsamsonii TaxID=1792511 RepID=UPI00254965DA|nr:Isopenicillin N synthase [Penicillium robsamsonii]KAJ5816468.1 Isopenicillin N synthase [Penicillium robsamsonii]